MSSFIVIASFTGCFNNNFEYTLQTDYFLLLKEIRLKPLRMLGASGLRQADKAGNLVRSG